MTDDTPLGVTREVSPASFARARNNAALQLRLERFSRSLAFVRAAVDRFEERYIDADHAGCDRITNATILASYLTVGCGIEVLLQDATTLLEQVKLALPEIPPAPQT